MSRQYKEPIPKYAHVMTVPEWQEAVTSGMFIPYDGIGYWAKDGKESGDDPFSTPPEDATHVAWYNK